MSDAAETKDVPKKSKKTLIIAIVGAVVLLAGGGGGAWWFFGRGEPDHEAAAAQAEAKREAARVFVTLENFVVNLADRDSDRYAQVGVVLEVESKEVETRLAAKMPAVRNEILLLLSSKVASQLTSREGKQKLAEEIAVAAARPLGWSQPDPQAAEDAAAKAKADKAKAKDAKDAKSKPKKTAEAPPNPVAHVHFASFIVQ